MQAGKDGTEGNFAQSGREAVHDGFTHTIAQRGRCDRKQRDATLLDRTSVGRWVQGLLTDGPWPVLGQVETDRASRGPAMRFRQPTKKHPLSSSSIACSCSCSRICGRGTLSALTSNRQSRWGIGGSARGPTADRRMSRRRGGIAQRIAGSVFILS